MIDWNIVGIGVALIGSILALARWFFTQFSALKTFISDQSDKILDKLEYHERHDDKRFADIGDRLMNANNRMSNDIWELKLRLAKSGPDQKTNSPQS